MNIKKNILRCLIFSLICIAQMRAADAGPFDWAVYEQEVMHKPLIKSIEPALGGKMDVQVIAARYIPEKNKTIILLKVSDLNMRNEIRDSPVLLRGTDAAGNVSAESYGQSSGFNITVTEHGKVISTSVFVKVLQWIDGFDLIQISYNSYGGAPNPYWGDVKIKLGLPQESGYTYVANFDLGPYATDRLDPQQPFIFLHELADMELNQKYKSTMYRFKAEKRVTDIAQLRSSERDWIRLKEQDCANRNEWQLAGTNGRCKFIYTVERINFLRNIN